MNATADRLRLILGDQLNASHSWFQHTDPQTIYVKLITEPKACPLNALYWYFMHTHIEQFNNNPRTRMVYANWQKKSEEQQQVILDRAEKLLSDLEKL